MDQFSKVINEIHQGSVHEGYSIDTSGNKAEPAEGLSPENISKLEQGEIPSLKFTFSDNTFLLFFDKETEQFSIEILGPLLPMSVLRQDERLKALKPGEKTDLNSVVAIIDVAGASRPKFLARAVQVSKTDGGNLAFSYPANRVLIERGLLYALRVGKNDTLHFRINAKVTG